MNFFLYFVRSTIILVVVDKVLLSFSSLPKPPIFFSNNMFSNICKRSKSWESIWSLGEMLRQKIFFFFLDFRHLCLSLHCQSPEFFNNMFCSNGKISKSWGSTWSYGNADVITIVILWRLLVWNVINWFNLP